MEWLTLWHRPLDVPPPRAEPRPRAFDAMSAWASCRTARPSPSPECALRPVRAMINARSNSAKPASTVTISFPCGVVVSAHVSASEQRPAPLSTIVARPGAATGRYCCKSLFALLIKNSLGCRRDFSVKMWGTSSPDRKLTGDLGNAIESTEIDGCRSRRPLAGKLSPGNFSRKSVIPTPAD